MLQKRSCREEPPALTCSPSVGYGLGSLGPTTDTITVDPNSTTGEHVEHEAILSEDLGGQSQAALESGRGKSGSLGLSRASTHP
jgi:hypothetical protein